jgi:hypothetical protein
MASVPVVPAAPARFSTITCCPRRSPRRCWTTLAMMSVVPPGGNGTMMRTGRVGQPSWAADGEVRANPPTMASTKLATRMPSSHTV